jgi:hypothetical protein
LSLDDSFDPLPPLLPAEVLALLPLPLLLLVPLDGSCTHH